MKGNVGYRKTDYGDETPNILDKYVLKETKIADIPLGADITTKDLKSALSIDELMKTVDETAKHRLIEAMDLYDANFLETGIYFIENVLGHAPTNNSGSFTIIVSKSSIVDGGNYRICMIAIPSGYEDIYIANGSGSDADFLWLEWQLLNVTIDDKLSDISKNPVQNKVVKTELDALKATIENEVKKKANTTDLYGTDNLAHIYKGILSEEDFKTNVNDELNTLTISFEPTEGHGLIYDDSFVEINDVFLNIPVSVGTGKWYIRLFYNCLTQEVYLQRMSVDDSDMSINTLGAEIFIDVLSVYYEIDEAGWLTEKNVVKPEWEYDYEYIKDLSDLQTDNKGSFLDAVNENADKIEEHEENKNNPHGVTKAQIGLGNVNNTSDASKPLSSAAKQENYYPEYSADEVDENTALYFDIAEMSPYSSETIYKRRIRGISGTSYWYDLVSKKSLSLVEKDYQSDGIISGTTPRTLSYGTDYLCFDDKASFTIAFSAKFPHTAEKNDLFVFGNTGTMAIQQNGSYGIRLVTFDNNISLCCYPNREDGYCVEPKSWDEYHHYAVVFDVENSTVTWYQDGVLADTAEMTNNEGSIRLQGGGNLAFFNNIKGVDTSGNDNVFGLQYFKVLNKALTAEEVDEIYQKHSVINYTNDITQYDNKFKEIDKILDDTNSVLSDKAPTSHRSTSATYGTATSTYYGHVKLSDSVSSTSGASSGYTAATPAAVKTAYDKAVEAYNKASSLEGGSSGGVSATDVIDVMANAFDELSYSKIQSLSVYLTSDVDIVDFEGKTYYLYIAPEDLAEGEVIDTICNSDGSYGYDIAKKDGSSYALDAGSVGVKTIIKFLDGKALVLMEVS